MRSPTLRHGGSDGTVNIRRAAESCGLSADTIRFYERRAVLPQPPRRPNGYREYSERHVETLRLAFGLRALGLSLEEMGAVLGLAHDGTCGDIRSALGETLAGALAQLDARIVELVLARRHVAGILDGLQQMRPGDEAVPGMTPCACVRLVEASEAAPAVAGVRSPR
ncbi:MAG: MerR family transcriptional regulator [Chloroflexi bacterium]|nr:MerR family transcriptional regulator [Chloroflexota bacterium]